MAKQIIWSLRAQQYRKNILHYWIVHNQSLVYSKRLNEFFKKAVILIANHPGIGRKTDIENVRAKLVRDYLIFYEETEDKILILTIWDNRRNPDALRIG